MENKIENENIKSELCNDEIENRVLLDSEGNTTTIQHSHAKKQLDKQTDNKTILKEYQRMFL